MTNRADARFVMFVQRFMVESPSATADFQLRASQEAQARGDFDAMLSHAQLASKAEVDNLNVTFRLLECLLYCGRVDEVSQWLTELEERAETDHELLCKVAEYHTHCANHESALRCYRQAVRVQPKNSQSLFALAAAEIAAGDLQKAGVHLTEVIALNPNDYDAYRNRATLRKQTAADNHIAELEALFEKGVKTPAGEVQIAYALAKEYEDIGRHTESFRNLKRGADKRRSMMSYRVDGDIAVMQRLQSVFNAERMERETAGCDKLGPLFILGLPRSGTTLVDRILSSHSQVDSLGEINNFAYALMHTIGQAGNKLKLIDLSAKMDFAELGRRYVDGIRRFGRSAPFLIDKTPLNYLYIGLIRLALPNARIVHVHRQPMDSCYGMYRALFRAGYPFSYDLDDLAKYYIACSRLMDHWRTVTNGGFFDVAYEDLIDDQEGISRKIIEYCGLDWQADCLNFQDNPAAVSTASSAQVRRPIYRDALQRWRRYEEELRPLANVLRSGGIDVDR